MDFFTRGWSFLAFELPSAHLAQVGRRAEGSIFFWIFLLEGGRSWHLNSLQRTWSKWAGALKGVFFFGFFYSSALVPGFDYIRTVDDFSGTCLVSVSLSAYLSVFVTVCVCVLVCMSVLVFVSGSVHA